MSIGDDRVQSICGSDYTYEADARVDPNDALIQAWCTLKPYPEGMNVADPGSLQKSVTTSDVPGTGQITAPGYVDGNAVIRFDLTAANTTTLGPRSFVFDVKVKTAAGKEYFVARGIWNNSGAYTLAT